MKIAIRGHQTREKEVARILESLGGENRANHSFSYNDLIYYLDSDNFIICALVPPVGYREYTLEEFEKEFPFKIGDKVTIAGLPDFPKIITKITWDCDAILYSFEDSNNTWFHADALKKFEMKEERNITLTLGKAKEWYKKGGELKEIALQAFSEKELNPLPRSWEEFVELTKFTFNGSLEYINGIGHWSNSCLPNKSIGESSEIWDKYLALFQLEQLRDCYNDNSDAWGWSYSIIKRNGIPELVRGCDHDTFLRFKNEVIAIQFLKYFRDLIEKAKDLI